MALSLEQLHQPLNDFFLKQFGSSDESVIAFRFDKYGSVLSDDDFIDPGHPEQGPLPTLARERFSALVNHLPIDVGDELNILLSEQQIDSAYLTFLAGSTFRLPDGGDPSAIEPLSDLFNTTKANALREWNALTLESMSGLILQYKPSLATPEQWYDSKKTDVWTTQTFTITAPSTPPPTPGEPLWRLRISDEAFNRILATPTQPVGPDSPDPVLPPEEISVPLRVLSLRREATVPTAMLLAATTPRSLADRPLSTLTRATALRTTDVRTAAASSIIAANVTPATDVHTAFHRQIKDLAISDRISVSQIVGAVQPTTPATTNQITVSFDYCLVHIQRPWMSELLLGNPDWYIPGHQRGDLTDPAVAGTLSRLPIAFVAIRNLVISANWSASDLENAGQATSFGPFKISASDSVSGSLEHKGLQTIGWILRPLPALPPNAAATAAPPPPPS